MAVVAIPVEQVVSGDVLDVAGHGFTVMETHDYDSAPNIWVAFQGNAGGGVPFNRGTILNVQRTTLESILRETLVAEFLKANWLYPESDTDDVDGFVYAIEAVLNERFTVKPK